jgi:hypothetical protein
MIVKIPPPPNILESKGKERKGKRWNLQGFKEHENNYESKKLQLFINRKKIEMFSLISNLSMAKKKTLNCQQFTQMSKT